MANVAEFITRRYRCLGCMKSWAKKSTAVSHAAVCPRDPATRGCRTCANYCPAIRGDGFDPMDVGESHGCAVGHPDFDAFGGRVVHCDRWEERDDG